MSAHAPPRPSPPWLRLVGLALLGHLVLLMALSALVVRPADKVPGVRYWSTRALETPPADIAEPPLERAAQPTAPEASPAPSNAARSVARADPLRHEARARSAPSHRLMDSQARAQSQRSRDARVEAAGEAPSARVPTAPSADGVHASSFQNTSAGEMANLPRVQIPQAATLSYVVSGTTRGAPYAAQSQLRWQPQDGRYEAEWLTQDDTPKNQRRWRSEGRLTVAGLMPERYAEKSRSERAAHFDPAGGRIRFSANTPDADWAPGGQDRLSAMLQLAALLTAAPERYRPGSSLTLQTAGARDALPTTWAVQADEMLEVDGQSVPCAVLVHVPDRPYAPTVALWLARPLHHLPARLRTVSAQGDVVEHNLQTVAFRP